MDRIRLLLCAFSLALVAWSAPNASADDTVVTKFDKPPAPLRTPPPKYPSEMKGVNGIVSITVIIDQSGNVAEATVAKSSDPRFEEASLEAIKKWKFKPAEVGGQPVKAKVTIPLRYNSDN